MKKQALKILALLLICSYLPLIAQVQYTKESVDTTLVGGSTQQIQQDNIKKGLVNNALEALSGQTAGVNVTTNGLT